MSPGPYPSPEGLALHRDPRLAGLEEAFALGSPVLESRTIDPAAFPPTEEFPLRTPRAAEILMVLPRPGGLLFHTKSFYPAGVLRLLSGGIQPGESILAAAAREVREETGLSLAPRRFLFHLAFRILREEPLRLFHTLAFLYPASTEAPVVQDASEEISRFVELPADRLADIAQSLEDVPPRWRLWGHFRAEPHRLLGRVLQEDQESPPTI